MKSVFSFKGYHLKICVTLTLQILLESNSFKARSHDPTLRIRFLVLKIGRRRLDGPISRFRYCSENVGRSFVVCSHDPIFRTSIWRQNYHKDIM